MARQAKQNGNKPAAATPATTPSTTPAEKKEEPTPGHGIAHDPTEQSPQTPPDENDSPDDEPPADVVAGECILILKQKAALGNGTRARGETICTISRGEDGHLDLESAEPVHGVIAAEVRTAINNLHLLDVAPIIPGNPRGGETE